LKIAQKPHEDHQVEVVVECSNEELEVFLSKASQKISRESKIPGFRPGKAPASVIKRMYGEEYIQNRAIEMMVDDVYPKVLDEAKIKPSGPGSLEKIISTNPPSFSFLIPLEPEVDLKDYHAIRIPYKPPQLDEAEVQKTLSEFQRMLATAEPVERPAAIGDMVYLKLSGAAQNPADGQDPAIFKESDTQVWIGDTSMEDPFPYKGFDQNLVGLSAEDESSATFTYPDEYIYPELSGKIVRFDFKILSVKYMKLPEFNDDFAKSLGDFPNFLALEDSVRARINDRNRDQYDQKYFDELLGMITDQAIIKYPPHMLDDEVNHLQEHFEEDLAAQKMDFDTYLKLNNKTRDSFVEEELKPAGRKRLERSLVLEQVAKDEKIQLSQDEISQELNATLSNLQGSKDFEKLSRKTNSQQLVNALAVQAAGRVMNRRVLSVLKSIATGEYKQDETTVSTSDKKPKKKTGKKIESDSQSVAEVPATSTKAKSSKPVGKASKTSKEKNEK
jgi:trigger factor